jgi:hypothetical protein
MVRAGQAGVAGEFRGQLPDLVAERLRGCVAEFRSSQHPGRRAQAAEPAMFVAITQPQVKDLPAQGAQGLPPQAKRKRPNQRL